VVSLLEADAGLRSSVRETVNEQHRRERDRERIDCGETPGQWMALARDLVRVGDQATGFIARHQSTGALCEEQLPAAKDALTKIELMATWIGLRLGGANESARRERGTARVPVAVWCRPPSRRRTLSWKPTSQSSPGMRAAGAGRWLTWSHAGSHWTAVAA
jgi:hypothetical protein